MAGHRLDDLGVANAGGLVSPGVAALATASAFMVLAGFPVVALGAAGTGLMQALTGDAYSGRVFGAHGAPASLATLVGLGLGGLVIDAVGVVRVLSAGAAMWIVGGELALLGLPADRPR